MPFGVHPLTQRASLEHHWDINHGHRLHRLHRLYRLSSDRPWKLSGRVRSRWEAFSRRGDTSESMAQMKVVKSAIWIRPWSACACHVRCFRRSWTSSDSCQVFNLMLPTRTCTSQQLMEDDRSGKSGKRGGGKGSQ